MQKRTTHAEKKEKKKNNPRRKELNGSAEHGNMW
jgi:hypothetical protein